MKYWIIDRIKYNKNTTLGYESNIDLVIETNYQYSITLGEWLNSNKSDLEERKVSLSYYFKESVKYVYVAATLVGNVEGLTEITKI